MDGLAVAGWGDKDRMFQLETRAPLQCRPDDNLWAASGHLGCYGWLRVVNRRIVKRTGPGMLDLPDRCWHDEHLDRVHPSEAADVAIDETAAEFGIDLS